MAPRLTPEEHLTLLKEIARSRNGKCLSNSYIKSSAKLEWQCEHGHAWEATPNKVKRGSWCPTCNGQPKVTIEQLKGIAISRGGKCLSNQYKNAHTKLEWQCKHGHSWVATPDKVKRGTWCPTCNKPEKGTFKEMQKIALSRNGTCLSEGYINTDTKLRWRCEHGHEWEATPYKVKQQGTWCPTCAGIQKLTLEDAQSVAHDRGGECLSSVYLNNSTLLKWRCEHGHKWEAQFASIKSGTWCPTCAGNAKLKFEDIIKQIEERGGRCLSTSMKNSNSKLKVECEHGHIWFPTATTLKSGHWCRTCAGSTPLGILRMREIAKSRQGKCLSDTYKNNTDQLEWECTEGHRWITSVNSITNGSWCPECSAGTGERIVKAHFEQLFDKPFTKVRPSWLVNSRGNPMELDGYNKELKLAFEHQGQQHYKLTTHFITTPEQLEQRMLDDEAKLELCNKHGVHLVQVPEVPSDLAISELKQFIRDDCLLVGIEISDDHLTKEIDLSNVYKAKENLLQELQEICAERGGDCLSDQYTSATELHTFRCHLGHEWETTPFQIRNGSWCHICGAKKSSDSRRASIESLQKLARSYNGELLSTSYDYGRQKLLWLCEKGHKFEMNPNSVKSGRWCPTCRKKLLTLEGVKFKIENKGGTLVSYDFVNSKSDITIMCHKGHQWTTKIRYIMDGKWCKRCAIDNRALATTNGISKALDLAKSKGGRLLSPVYKNRTSLLNWQCEHGHEWKASYALIMRGQWCPTCRKVEKNANTLLEYKQIALSRGGKCFSDTYVNAKTKLLWECKRGHQFFSSPDNVKQGKWCPDCKGERISETKNKRNNRS